MTWKCTIKANDWDDELIARYGKPFNHDKPFPSQKFCICTLTPEQIVADIINFGRASITRGANDDDLTILFENTYD